jgi:prepilin-type N-terminal cleavage/methylation domain-containing protein
MFSIKNIKERREEGFTLIELLIVIVIIGVLASIGVPMYLNQAVKADKVKAKADVAAISSALINGASTSTLSSTALPRTIYVSHDGTAATGANFTGTVYTDSLTQPIPTGMNVWFATDAAGEVTSWCVSELDTHGGSYSITSATGSIATNATALVCTSSTTVA